MPLPAPLTICGAAGMHKSADKPGGFIPFLSAVKPAAPAAQLTEAQDIEVDLELQQALAESMAAPSADKGLHTKGNAMRDISNWRLPLQAGKAKPAGTKPSPLTAIQTGQCLLRILP